MSEEEGIVEGRDVRAVYCSVGKVLHRQEGTVSSGRYCSAKKYCSARKVLHRQEDTASSGRYCIVRKVLYRDNAKTSDGVARAVDETALG